MRLRLIAAGLLITTMSSASHASSAAKTISLKDLAAAKTPAATAALAGATLPATPEDVVIPVAQQPAQPAEDNKTTEASPEQVCDTLHAAAEAHDLPTPFFIRLIWQESKFDRNAVSPVGAQGVAQFMPRVAAAMGLDNPFDPIEALPMSAQLLRTLHNQFGNLGLAAAAYNAGPKRVIDWLTKRGQLPKETRDYVLRITGRPAEEWRGANTVVQIDTTVPRRAPCRSATTDVLASVPATLNPNIADDIPADPPKKTRIAKRKGGKTVVAATKVKVSKGKIRLVAAARSNGKKGKGPVIAEMSAAKSAKKTAKSAAKAGTKAAAAKSGKSASAKSGSGPMRLASVAKAR
jgi:hypothetical protein